MATKFHYYQHSCFSLTKNGVTLLFDPYLDGNEEGVTAKDIKADYILVSHAHFDHIGSALEIAKNCGATIISTAEIAGLAGEHGCQGHGMNIGGTYKFPFGKVRMTTALHSSGIAGGIAGGFIVDLFGTTLYYAGDTGIFSDMQLLPKLDAFDYAVLPIGGNFTMDAKDAALAVEMLKPKYVIPVHYNTWPVIGQDPMVFKRLVEETAKAKVIVVPRGSETTIE